MTVVTRIAPSPTGSMHIGTARTALFNQLFSRHHGGKYLVRVEDTDRERSTDENVEVIFDGLRWLGLESDEPPVFQSERLARHVEAVEEMLRRGGAYYDWMPMEQMERAKADARAQGHVYRSPLRDQQPEPGGMFPSPYVVRLRAPLDGELVVDDLVKGPVRFRHADLDDLVLLRSDGTPTYNLAVVVDDHDMGITHVIRGDDHLNNAARQTLIYRALGWETPAFAHIPLIHGPDGAKLSKRHGAQAVGEFREMGYLPEAMRNYLARLGWGHGDDEIFTDAQAAAWFDVADVVKAPARLDWDKLNFVNQRYIRSADDTRLAALTAEAHGNHGMAVPDVALPRLAAAIALVKEAAQTVLQLADLTRFVLKARPLALDERTRKLLTEEALGRLGRLRAHLAGEADWTPPTLETSLRAFAEAEGVGLGKVGPWLRGVLSGGAPAPDLASTLTALGRDEALGRMDDALSATA